MTKALFERDGDGFVASVLTQGAWHPREANGGAVLALVGHCLEDVATLVPMTVSRLTADLVRPVPLGPTLHVVSTVLREGKKIQVVAIEVRVGDVVHVRATALRLRETDLSGYHDLPESTTEADASAGLPAPESLPSLRDNDRPDAPGFMGAIDLRRVVPTDGSAGGYWTRLDAAVVAGEPIRPTARLAASFDFANLIGVARHVPSVTLINPDVTGQVLRPPKGEWIALTGDTRFQPSIGRGISYATLSDELGYVGLASVSQLMQIRP